MKEILVIDHDEDVFVHIRENLQSDHVQVHHSHSVEDGLHRMFCHSYSLIVMDVLLSHQCGHEVISVMRQMQAVPIFVLSEDATTQDKVLALNSGADDFLAKPYDLEECLARTQALLRRYTELNYIKQRGYAIVSHDELLLDTGRRRVQMSGKDVTLSRKEYDLLLYLLKNRNQVLTYEQIYETVWNDLYLNDNSTIFYQVGQLRRKLGTKDFIESVHGVGYRLRAD